jgi:hypothetical protein
MKPSTHLKERLEFSFNESSNLKSFRSYLKNTLYNYEENNDGNREYYTPDDYKLLLIFENALGNVLD